MKSVDEKDSWIILYRILGNDLPPRHSHNQTLTNLLFILQNEPTFIHIQKIWILNRIVHHDQEKKLIDVLNKYNQFYIRIPFYWHEYRQIPYYFSPRMNINSTDLFHGVNLLYEKIRIISGLYHKKNLYVMNNNAARNFALRHGKYQTKSQWLMVFDGNCFLSQRGFDQIFQSLRVNGSYVKYFIVPMSRLIENKKIFRKGANLANEEPQIIFRRDSTVEYLETLRYGHRPKEELLVYLGAYKFHSSFSQQRKPLLTNITNFQYTGFVFRLYSGFNPNNERFILDRTCTRLQGIMFFLEKLDKRINHHPILPQSSKTDRHQCLRDRR
ncbi:unnamed protein product [Adineta ricciae]|uniref:Uncharacterized protein n=1 Tax=Adineta ricciae TaxID=249248 RepID=A0A815STX8_ADIRI|nr:unnamed protein product [Adineta ricciae]